MELLASEPPMAVLRSLGIHWELFNSICCSISVTTYGFAVGRVVTSLHLDVPTLCAVSEDLDNSAALRDDDATWMLIKILLKTKM